MPEVIDDATIAIWADLSRPGAMRAPFILDRDLLDDAGSTLAPVGGTGTLVDWTALVIGLDAGWGATDWQGPRTFVDAGGASFDVWDPDRALDIANDELVDPPAPGRLVQLRVDGQTFQTLYTDTIGHALADGISSVGCIDVIAVASRVGVTTALPAGKTEDQVRALVAAAGWTGRVLLTGGGFVTSRAADTYTGSLMDGLQRLQEAELGVVYADALGSIYFAPRDYQPEPGAEIMVGMSPGIATTALGTAVDRRVVNAIYITPIAPESPVMVYADPVAQTMVGGEVAATADESDLLLTAGS